jgi:hypothetical protein
MKNASFNTEHAMGTVFLVGNRDVVCMCNHLPVLIIQDQPEIVTATGATTAYRKNPVVRHIEGEMDQPVGISLVQHLACF